MTDYPVDLRFDMAKNALGEMSLLDVYDQNSYH